MSYAPTTRGSYDLDAIKAGLPDYLDRIGARIFERIEDRITAACPVHGGTKANFHATRQADGTWIWICRSGCGGAGGSVIDLHADLHGLARGRREAIAGAAEVLGIAPEGKAPLTHPPRRRLPQAQPRPAARPEAKNPPPENWDDIHRTCRIRVYESPEIQTQLAEEFNVSPETIRQLTFTSDALGWSAKHQRPLYLYEGGTKLRRLPTDRVRFRWLIGRAEKPWRSHLLQRPEITRVFLTEGESDAITLLDSGLENLFPEDGETGTAIIAIPGTSFLEEWASLFAGRDLVLCTDNDPAGRKALNRIGRLCRPYVRSLGTYAFQSATTPAPSPVYS